jgi:hypothetical protein
MRHIDKSVQQNGHVSYMQQNAKKEGNRTQHLKYLYCTSAQTTTTYACFYWRDRKCYVTRNQCHSVQKQCDITTVQKQTPVQKFINRHQQQQYISVFITIEARYFSIHYSSSNIFHYSLHQQQYISVFITAASIHYS